MTIKKGRDRITFVAERCSKTKELPKAEEKRRERDGAQKKKNKNLKKVVDKLEKM